MGWAKALLGKKKEAIQHHLETLLLAQDLGIKGYEMAKTYRYLADVYRMYGEWREAEKYYEGS